MATTSGLKLKPPSSDPNKEVGDLMCFLIDEGDMPLHDIVGVTHWELTGICISDETPGLAEL